MDLSEKFVFFPKKGILYLHSTYPQDVPGTAVYNSTFPIDSKVTMTPE